MELSRQEQEVIEMMRQTSRQEGMEHIQNSDYSQGMSILQQSIEALVASGLKSSNPDVRQNADDMNKYLGDKYKGDVSLLLRDPSTVKKVLKTAQTWVEYDEQVAMDVDALESSFREAGMTNSQLKARADEGRNSLKPEEEYSRKVSNVDGKEYVVSNTNPDEYYTEEAWQDKSANIEANALGWGTNEGGEYADLQDK